MLNPSDVYVSGGSNNLLACWTDKVTKYDASSFYNWEQDNLPLHDLDERTHLLWEKLGHPTSALTGMSFIVSADATSSCNPLYFTTLSSCIAALPEVINCPILIEVASFGNLGGLNLSNKAFGPNGALEIINRNSAFAFPKSLSATLDQYSRYTIDDDRTAYVDPTYASAFNPGGVMSIAAAANAASPCPAHDHFDAHLFTKNESGNTIYISSGASVSDRISDPRFVNPYVFVKRTDARKNNRLTAALSSTIDPWNTTATNYSGAANLRFTPFDKNNIDTTYDVSTFNFLNDSEEVWGHPFGTDTVEHAAMSFSYFNKLDYIKVDNCRGPVYIRNFNVDGEYSVDKGIEVTNSKVSLERTSISRCNKAGLYISNSEVDVLRGIICYRNYENTEGSRVGIPFESKRLAYKTLESYGAGIYSNNSTLNFKDTYDRDIEKSIQASGSAHYEDYNTARKILSGIYGDPSTHKTIPTPSREALTCFSRNDIGIHAVNSLITGGRTELVGSSTGGNSSWNDATDICSELNTEAGVLLENSVLDYSGRISVDGNYFGLDSKNSKISVDTLNTRFNQSTGLKLNDSSMAYNKNLYASFHLGQAANIGPEIYSEGQLGFFTNGQDITCDNSTIRPVYTSSMPSIYGMFYASGAFGREDNSDKLLPSVHLKGESDVDFIHSHMVRDPGAGNTSSAQYGLLVHAEDQSTFTTRGSSQYANIFLGPTTRNDSVNVAGLYAENGSNIKIQGPTTIGRFGVDVLAEDNSNIEITPHQTNNGSLLVSAFDLSSGDNHTMVELHSTRACLVANRNSNILMENLGDYQNFWENGAYGSAITASYDYANSDYTTYTSGGYIQFYPNANVDDADVVANPTNVQVAAYAFETDGPSVAPRYLIHTIGNDVSDTSTGGMCVRAVENSLVQANNVHFPATWPNPSSVVYDLQGDDPLPGPNCSRLFIWNIADNSLLKASYLSVSGLHPRDSGYYGPSGVWGNTVSGAPSSTPDTSSLSILDYYGQNTVSEFGKATAENFGAFRLYFSTDPAANFLAASGTNKLDGFARQVFAQGYNFSGNLIASSSDDFEASSQYISVLKRDENGDIHPSGFYYASAMVASPNTVKAVLDDSALNTFANAKHNTVGKSGLAKVVEGYYATSAFGGDSYNEYTYGTGLASINNFDLKKDN